MAVNGARGVVVDFKRAVKQDNKEESYDESKDYPEVLFTSGVRRVITPEEWSIEVAGEPQATRVQCPLALAWALSIHKAQGTQSFGSTVAKASVFSLIRILHPFLQG
jgi:ATP-dependent DNA helicase PIF1